MKKIVFLFSCFFVLAAASGCALPSSFIEVNINQENEKTINQEINNNVETGHAPSLQNVASSTANIEMTRPGISTVRVPDKLELPVAFASQAPFANWDALHEEACEEASMITVAKHLKGQPLDEEIMEDEIQRLARWEAENGYKVDLTAAEAVAIIQKYFGLSARVEKEATVDRIKYELARGNLVMVPAAGRELGNPYFRQPGPIYHMLVIKGYNASGFVTNDVGTKRGDGYKYKSQILINAIHDWNHDLAEGGMTDEEMARGEKVIVVVNN